MLSKLKVAHFFCLLALAVIGSTGSVALAATPAAPSSKVNGPADINPKTSTPADPNPSLNPVLVRIQSSGAKLYYLGISAGLDGWFILKDGQMQVAYATPDNKSAIIGALFGADGDNVTALQVQSLVSTNQEVATALGTSTQEQAAIAQAGAGQAVPTSPVVGTLPSVSVSPGERLVQDLTAAHGVVLGIDQAPELFMVMSPTCQHCQATWRVLHDAVFQHKVRVHFIPIGIPDTDEERAAAILLHVKDPLNAWDKYVAGDTKQLEGTPDQAYVAEVRANHTLVDSWNIQATPYLVYRGKNGKIKVLQGEPEKISSVLDDLQ